MKLPLLMMVALCLSMSACKKDNQEPDEPEFDGSYPGKIKDINGSAWKFYYTEDGKIAEYKYNYFGITKTATVTWESNQVICNDGIGFTYTRPFNSAGYAIPGSGDISSGQNWSYNSDNTIAQLSGANYYWTNGNIDSVVLGTTRTIYEYSSNLDTRDFGARYIPQLSNFPVYNLNVKNLKTKSTTLNGTDTVSVKLYTYTFNSNNRVASELVDIVTDSDTSYYSLRNYSYYE